MTAETAAAPAIPEEVEARYRALLAEHQQAYDRGAKGRGTLLRLLLGVGGVLVYLAFQSLHTAVSPWIFVGGFVAFVTLVAMSMNRQTKLSRKQRLLGFYDRALMRVDGSEPQSGRTETEAGQNLRPDGHLYEYDLDLLGPDSLFGLLATVRTGPGERGLANYLLQEASHAETLRRQEAVKEFLPQTVLREEIALLGATKFHQISGSFFDEWLVEEVPVFHPAFRVVLVVTAGLNVALLLAGFVHLRTWGDIFPNLAAVLVVQSAISAYLRPKVMPLLQGGARLELNVKLLADGLAVMQGAEFVCPKMKELQRKSFEPAGAVKLLKKLVSSLAIVEQRSKEYFLILSLLLAAGTQAAISIADWKRKNATAMQEWLAAWAEFEALNAIATYAFEHPQDAWPELLPAAHAPTFEGVGVGHPLLAGSVTNDVSLGPETRFFLISGSNMSGKSTLLRSIGTNAVLAYAGAPVRAKSLRLTPLRLGASLALTDSLAEGRSKFRAEVERLSAIVAGSETHGTLFLVDEIFSGTNSADRRTAAGAVVNRLLANGAIGALSTHDLALAELVTDSNGGMNVHMASPDANDPLAFDYKLKPGVNTTSNALAIVRMLGL